MEQRANQAQPRHSPARTSVSQWTPRRTRVVAMLAARPAAAPPMYARLRLPQVRVITKAKLAKAAAAAVAWPEGNEGPENPVRWRMLGRARSTAVLMA